MERQCGQAVGYTILGMVGILLSALPGSAQEVVVRGRVVESADSAWVAGATVHLGTLPPYFTTSDGRFEFTDVRTGGETLTVEALGT